MRYFDKHARVLLPRLQREHGPMGFLPPFVISTWNLSCKGKNRFMRLFPSNDTTLFVVLKGNPVISGKAYKAGEAYVEGATTRWREARLSGEVRVIGARLVPGASAALLGIPSKELVDTTAALSDFGRSEGRLLAESMAGVKDLMEQKKILCLILFSLLRSSPVSGRIKTAAGLVSALTPRPEAIVGDGGLGLGARQIRRLSLQCVGISPSQISRLARIRRALDLLGREPRLNWQDLVYSCAFSDQSHLIREFNQLAGWNQLARQA